MGATEVPVEDEKRRRGDLRSRMGLRMRVKRAWTTQVVGTTPQVKGPPVHR